MSESDEPDVYYVDTAASQVNYYDPVTNAIILDEKLKDYPLAHQYVLAHEMEHHNNGLNPLPHLWHELKTDIRMAFSEAEAIEQFREYEDAQSHELRDLPPMVSAAVTNMVRMWWQFLIFPTGIAYRKLKHRVPRFKKNVDRKGVKELAELKSH